MNPTPEDAERVFKNPAFRGAFTTLRANIIADFLTAKTPDESWKAKLKMDALESVWTELEEIAGIKVERPE
jgi:hypothetical protein